MTRFHYDTTNCLANISFFINNCTEFYVVMLFLSCIFPFHFDFLAWISPYITEDQEFVQTIHPHFDNLVSLSFLWFYFLWKLIELVRVNLETYTLSKLVARGVIVFKDFSFDLGGAYLSMGLKPFWRCWVKWISNFLIIHTLNGFHESNRNLLTIICGLCTPTFVDFIPFMRLLAHLHQYF